MNHESSKCRIKMDKAWLTLLFCIWWPLLSFPSLPLAWPWQEQGLNRLTMLNHPGGTRSATWGLQDEVPWPEASCLRGGAKQSPSLSMADQFPHCFFNDFLCGSFSVAQWSGGSAGWAAKLKTWQLTAWAAQLCICPPFPASPVSGVRGYPWPKCFGRICHSNHPLLPRQKWSLPL